MINPRHQHAIFLIMFIAFSILSSCVTADEKPMPKTTVTSDSTALIQNEVVTSGKKRIVFFGNSLTAAYGLSLQEGYVSLLQERFDSLGIEWQAVGAGLSGETSAGGLTRLPWVLQRPLDVFVLELGANDGLRGIDPKVTLSNLSKICALVKERYPTSTIVLCGMQAPPNMGQGYTDDFRNIFPTLAKKYEAILIPFFLEGVAGIPALNLPDGIHPNIQGQKIVENTVWKYIKDIIEK